MPPHASGTSQPPQVDTGNRAWLVAFSAMALLGLASAILVPKQSAVQQFYFRLVMGLAVAGIAAAIPGFLEIHLRWLRNSLRAGGALGVFVLVYLYNPPTIVDPINRRAEIQEIISDLDRASLRTRGCVATVGATPCMDDTESLRRATQKLLAIVSEK
jgi:hypothetical protein